MRRVVYSQKGGVGKTSIACNLAALSAASGLRTLVIDLDPQANATRYLLGGEPAGPTLFEFFDATLSFLGTAFDAADCVHRTRWPGLDVVPSNPRLAELQPRLEARHKIYKLREALPLFGRYQSVYIDTAPAMSVYTLSALIAADRCLIPCDCDAFSRRGLDELLEHVREVVEDHNENLEIEGIVINQFQPRARLPRRMVEELRARELPVIEALLGQSVKMRESHEANRPLVWLAPRHKLTEEYRTLFEAIEDRVRPRPRPRSSTPRAVEGRSVGAPQA